MSKNVVDMIAKRRASVTDVPPTTVERGTKCHVCDKVNYTI